MIVRPFATLLILSVIALSAAPARAVDKGRSGLIYQTMVKAPDVTLGLPEGYGTVSLADHPDDVRVVVFWASWSPYARQQLADLVAIQKKYQGQGLQVIAVSDEPSATIKTFADQAGLTFPAVVGDPEVAQAFGGVPGYPTTFVIGRHGYIYTHYAGLVPRAVLEHAIDALI